MERSTDQFAAVADHPDHGPVVMLNLVRYREESLDGEGTGHDAYLRYSKGFVPMLKRIGGTILWAGDVTGVALGDQSEDWDYAVLVQYPSRQAFVDTLSSADYDAINHHRENGLERHLILAVNETYTKFGR